MRMKGLAISMAATIAMCGAAVLAQTPQQPPAPADQSASTAITVVGCVQKESAVLSRNPIAGNIGMDNEFVLTNSVPGPASAADDQARPGAAPPQPASPGNFGKVYRVTGEKEADLKSYVGQRVEITGTLKNKETVKDDIGSIGTSGRTNPTPANTPEIAIDAVKPLGGSCTAR
jgi:hypothetical protein